MVDAPVPGSEPPPTVEEVGRIVALRNPVVRNLEITHCYGRLSAAMVARTGPCANWCTFATWASRQAGRTIRGEDLIETLRARLNRGPEFLHPLGSFGRALLRRGLFDPHTRVGRLTARVHTPFDAFERTSDAVARGNLKVFAEIGLAFARYLNEVPAEAAADGPELRAFLGSLRPGEPPEGQRLLRQAFTRYTRAAAVEDERERTQLLLLANLEIGMHEQTRLQPEIRESLDSPYSITQGLDRVALRLVVPLVRRPVKRVLAGRPGRPGRAAGSRRWSLGDTLREIITESLMVMSLPGRRLHLGVHLGEPFPEALAQLSDPELTELVERFEAVVAAGDTGARDWSDFNQRMCYIAHLFRAFHVDPELLGPPFTAEQVASFAAGRVPDGAI